MATITINPIIKTGDIDDDDDDDDDDNNNIGTLVSIVLDPRRNLLRMRFIS
jgi:hypothetical protein